MADKQAFVRELDLRGLNCPLPVLKARKALGTMRPGERLLLLATDPRAPEDLAELCRVAGHRLVESGEEAGIYRFVLARG
jgi:tRNA 2-thiouridine synthesizing protein A